MFCKKIASKIPFICKIQRAHFIYTKRRKNAKRLYIYKASLRKKQDNFHYVLYTKARHLRYVIFHENFEVGIYMQKA